MNFISRTNFHDDILLIAVGIVGTLGGLMIIYSSAFGSQNFSSVNGASLDFKKAQILAMVQSKDLLTEREKEMVSKELIGERVQMYDFSDSQIKKILDALNKN